MKWNVNHLQLYWPPFGCQYLIRLLLLTCIWEFSFCFLLFCVFWFQSFMEFQFQFQWISHFRFLYFHAFFTLTTTTTTNRSLSSSIANRQMRGYRITGKWKRQKNAQTTNHIQFTTITTIKSTVSTNAVPSITRTCWIGGEFGINTNTSKWIRFCFTFPFSLELSLNVKLIRLIFLFLLCVFFLGKFSYYFPAQRKNQTTNPVASNSFN